VSWRLNYRCKKVNSFGPQVFARHTLIHNPQHNRIDDEVRKRESVRVRVCERERVEERERESGRERERERVEEREREWKRERESVFMCE
jgi:hypothetical protein